MAKLDWVIPCERSIVEERSNLLSLVGILEDVGIPSALAESAGSRQPFIPHKFSIVQLWSRSDAGKPETLEARTKVFATNGKQIGAIAFKVDLINYKRTRVISVVPGFVWTGPGELVIKVEMHKGNRWTQVWRGALNIKIDDAPAQPSGAVTEVPSAKQS